MNGLPCWSMPAPWGGIAVYACEGEPTAIVPTLTPVTEPEAAPEAVSEILALLEDVLAVPRATDPSVKDKLFATRIFRELPEFTRRVLTLTADIAPAAWTSYTELAEGIGSPAAARAVGQALAHNPFPILIGCQRVCAASDRNRFDILRPDTFRPQAYLGRADLSGVAQWLRLADFSL